jgi:hypothetical protein
MTASHTPAAHCDQVGTRGVAVLCVKTHTALIQFRQPRPLPRDETFTIGKWNFLWRFPKVPRMSVRAAHLKSPAWRFHELAQPIARGQSISSQTSNPWGVGDRRRELGNSRRHPLFIATRFRQPMT